MSFYLQGNYGCTKGKAEPRAPCPTIFALVSYLLEGHDPELRHCEVLQKIPSSPHLSLVFLQVQMDGVLV